MPGATILEISLVRSLSYALLHDKLRHDFTVLGSYMFYRDPKPRIFRSKSLTLGARTEDYL